MRKSLKGINKKACILVVDDDSSLLKFFKIHLTSVFANVTVVENATEALKLMDEKEFELVLTDIRMPKISGIELIEEVKRRDSSIIVYAVSAYYDGSETQLKYIDGFLKKPFDIEFLNDMIVTGLRLRKYFIQLKGIVQDNQKVLDLVYGGLGLDDLGIVTAHKTQVEKLITHIRQGMAS